MQKKRLYILIGLALGLLASASASLGLFSDAEHRIQDRLFTDRPIDDRLLLITIDDASLSTLGQWPLPRSTYASLFQKLNEADPLAVGFDVMLAEPSRLQEVDDQVLARTVSEVTYPLIFPLEGRHADTALTPLQIFTEHENVHLGHVNLRIDPDSVVRNIPGHITAQNARYSSFAEAVVAHAGVRYTPFEEGFQRIVYGAGPGSVPSISLDAALATSSSVFRDTIIFIGATAPDLHDEQPTPVSRGVLMPGVEIQATVANQLIHGWRLEDAPWWCVLIWLLSAALIPALLFAYTERLRILIPSILLLALIHTVIGIVLFSNGTVVPLMHIIGTALLAPIALFTYQYTLGEYEKRKIKHAFGKYVSPQVLQEILLHPEMVSLGGEKREVTVLFSDIRSFTTLSEQTTPEELVDILNEYFTEMTHAILEEGGVLDKYIGDAIMAFWGAPLPDPDQADAAVRASQKMLTRLEILNEKLEKRGKPRIQIGVGLYSGPAIAGNIGSEKRFDYTVIGDTVNVASRLEGLTKQYDTFLIIGESTKNKLSPHIRTQYLDTTQVKGREEPLRIYSVAE